MLAIKPDPENPLGGYAIIEFDADVAGGSEVQMTLQNIFSEKFLGEAGWQSDKAYFGPYPVQASGGRGAIKIGSEIVNHIEEYTALRVELGGRSFDISWPDDILPGPAAATLGGVSATPQLAGNTKGPALVGKARPESETNGEGGEGPDSVDRDEPTEGPTQIDPPVGTDPKGGRTRTFVAVGIIAALAVLAGGYWYMTQQDQVAALTDPILEEEDDDEEEDAAPPVVPVVVDPCSDGSLTALVEEGYAALLEGLAGCGASVTADQALLLIEGGVAANDPIALLTLGQLYDGDVSLDGIETEMNLTYADNPARAAEYYARSVAAGNGIGADEALATVCQRLGALTDTLSTGAFQEYCE